MDEIHDSKKGSSRRDLLRFAALAPAGIALAQAPPPQTSPTMSGVAFEPRDKVRLAFIGIGGRGNSLIDDFIDAGEADVAAKLNIPLPAMGMCLLLSLPESNWEHFYRWTTTIIDCSVEGDIDGIRDCFAEISDFANTWVAERREVSKGDVVDAMLQAEIDGRPWTENEIQGTFVLLFSAGHQTTADALSYAMHHLATHPEDRRRLCEHP